jgi:hypothetical protein
MDRSAIQDHRSAWWEDHDQVVAFARVLVEAGYLGSCQFAVINYFKTPWRWKRQHAEWVRVGNPDPFDPGFDALLRNLDSHPD